MHIPGRPLPLLALGLTLTMAAPEPVPSQDLINSRVLDGTWKMTRYSFTATASKNAHGHTNITGVQLGQGGCSKNENITWRAEGKSFSQVSSTPDTLFGSSGIWEIQSLVPIAGNNDHALKQELNPNYLKFRAYKDGATPLDLCIATQVLPPEIGSFVKSAFTNPAPAKTNDGDNAQLIVMVDFSNPKQCPSRWVQFGGVCAKDVEFLKGHCVSGACMDLFKKTDLETTHNITEPARSEADSRLAGLFGRVVLALSLAFIAHSL